jgi:hypothetical protein
MIEDTANFYHGEAVQTPIWRGCANSIIPSPGSCLVPNRPPFEYPLLFENKPEDILKETGCWIQL